MVSWGLWAGVSLGLWAGAAWGQPAVCASAKVCARACSAGDAAACNEMGARHYMGDGVQADDRKARRYYQQACDGKDLVGCANLGWMVLEGQGGPRDEGAARAHFLRACGGGQPEGCGGAGVMAANAGAGLEARQNLEKGCDAGDGRECRVLGELLRVPYPEAAVSAFERGCAANDGASCGAAAERRPPAEAAPLRLRACERGDGASCVALARTQAAHDAPSAQKSAHQGCELGDGDACLLSHQWAAEGLGGAPPARDARRWLRLGCDKGDARSCGALAASLDAEGRDLLSARLYAGLACEGGVSEACPGRMNLARPDDGPLYNKASLLSGRLRQSCGRRGRGAAKACRDLADYHLTGTGVREDRGEAMQLYEKACGRGDSVACGRLGRLLAR